MEKDFTHGLTVENMRENGKLTKCTEKEPLHGLMEESISDNMSKTRKKVMENSSGQINGATEESGLMENNMEKELMLLHKEQKSMVNGVTESAFVGSEAEVMMMMIEK